MATKPMVGILGGLMLAVGYSQSAGAAVITFDDVVNSVSNEIRTSAISGGFNFTSTHFHVIDTVVGSFGGNVQNGTQYATLDSPTLAGAVTMAQVGGGVFSLASFQGAEAWLDDAQALSGGFPNAATIRVVGNFFGGGTITANFALDGIKDGVGGLADFQTFNFGASWTNLVSVVWDGFTAAGGRGSISFDNISTTRVPEPATLALFGLGALGFAGLRRRKLAQ